MTGPGNQFERRVAEGGGWPRAPRWMTSNWYIALMALASGGNAWVATRRWMSEDGFGGFMAAALAVSLCYFAVMAVRARKPAGRVDIETDLDEK